MQYIRKSAILEEGAGGQVNGEIQTKSSAGDIDGAGPGYVLQKPKAQKYEACPKMWREKSSCSGSWSNRPFKGIQRRGAFLIFEHKA